MIDQFISGQARYQELLRMRLQAQGEEHHFETILERNGINWVNHSMATTVEMTWHALRDMNGPILLIIGGVDRGEEHQSLVELVNEKVDTIVCIGSTPWKYFNVFRDVTDLMVQAVDLKEAVDYAALLARKSGTTVLFSPTCPSYDAFDNYKNRG
ncbi:MAG: glutamate ligase domain-containing protein, partial [Bacteroidia bacterium]